MSNETTTGIRTLRDLGIFASCAAVGVASRYPDNQFFSYDGIYNFLYNVSGAEGASFVEHALAAVGTTALLTTIISGLGNAYRRSLESIDEGERNSAVRNTMYGVSCFLMGTAYLYGSLNYELWQGNQRGAENWNQIAGDALGVFSYAGLVARETSKSICDLVNDLVPTLSKRRQID